MARQKERRFSKNCVPFVNEIEDGHLFWILWRDDFKNVETFVIISLDQFKYIARANNSTSTYWFHILSNVFFLLCILFIQICICPREHSIKHLIWNDFMWIRQKKSKFQFFFYSIFQRFTVFKFFIFGFFAYCWKNRQYFHSACSCYCCC